MAVFHGQSPFESSFENLSNKAGQVAAGQVKKQAAQLLNQMVGDVKQQLTGQEAGQAGSQPLGFWQQLGLKPVSEEKKQEIEEKKQKELAQIRQNLQKINEEIDQVRKRKKKEEQEKQKQEAQKKQEKKALEEKKKQDPIWKRMLKGNQGAHEGNKHVSG